MSTITTINASDQITSSRAVINTNFSNLNTDKIETSTLDTDTALTANSDSKIATQKAVKAYVDAGGNVNASTTSKGIVEEATSAEMIAGTAAGGTGARLFLNPSLVAETGTDKIVKTKSTGKLDASIVPSSTITTGATTKDISSATSTTIAHSLGVVPAFVKITGVVIGNATEFTYTMSNYTNAQVSLSVRADTGTGTGEEITQSFRLYRSTSEYTTGTITTDATNITIAWSLTGSPTGTANLVWEAFK